MHLTLADFADAQSGVLLGLPDGTLACGVGSLRFVARPPKGEIAFYAPDFFLKERAPWIIPAQCVVISRATLLRDLRPFGEELTAIDWHAPSFSRFVKVFQDAEGHFRAHGWQKLVPVCFERGQATITPYLRARMLARMLVSPVRVLPYGFWDKTQGMLGATPEVLFHVTRGELITAALAGTRLSGAAAMSLLRDEKERREHQLVIDFLAQALGAFGETQVGETSLLTLPHLTHLHTELRCVLRKSVELESLVRTLHPTPALGAVPHEAAFPWLSQLAENDPRGRFGAPFGVVLPDGDLFCVVAIRNLQWQASTLSIGSGCGIVRGSDIDSEWHELSQKRESVRRTLGI